MDANELILLGVGACGASGPLVVANDTFTDADGVALTSHTGEDGLAWTAHKGSYDILSNQARCTAISGSAIAGKQTNQADVTLSTTQVGSASKGHVARLSDSTHFWLMYRSSGNITLYENGGTQRAQVSHTLVSGETWTMACSGATITCSAGSDSCQYSSATSNQSATIHGLYAEIVGALYDNFRVTVP